MTLAVAASGALLALSCALALAWLWQARIALRGMPTLQDLTRIESASPALLAQSERPHLTQLETGSAAQLPQSERPDLSVIVPACNEAESIEACLRSLLGTTGLRLEILAVDDRSTDATGALMDRVAAENAASGGLHTMRVLHVAELPAGWLGKPHAMAVAAQQANADWLLFTDGDVHFAPEALERSLRAAMSQGADHFVLIPTLIVASWSERAVQAAMQVLAQWSIRLWKVSNPRARDFVGVGGFNLMRREAYRAVGGFESMPMEVLDDLRIGWKLKRAGFRARVALGPDLVQIRWIQGPLSVLSLIEKNSFAVFRFRPILHALASLGMVLLALAPVVAIGAGFSSMHEGGWIEIAGWAQMAAIAIVYWANRKLMQGPAMFALLFSPCVLLVAFAFFRSMVLALSRGGIRWRGTFYPLKTLKENCGNW